MSSTVRQALLRHLPSLLFAAFFIRYFFLVLIHDPTKSRSDPTIKESSLAFIVSAIEFVLFLFGSQHTRGRAALFGLLTLLWAILFLWIEDWRYPFG